MSFEPDGWIMHFCHSAVPYVLGGLEKQIKGKSARLFYDEMDLTFAVGNVCPTGRQSLMFVWQECKTAGIAFPHYMDNRAAVLRTLEIMRPIVRELSDAKLVEYQERYSKLLESRIKHDEPVWMVQHNELVTFIENSYSMTKKEVMDYVKANFDRRDAIKKTGANRLIEDEEKKFNDLIKEILSKRAKK